MSPDISVVIPTFRRPALLAEAIDSVLAQKGVTSEILVIDDCPLGSAKEAVAPYLDRGVTYRRSPAHSGGRPAQVRNLGWREARAEIIHFLDDDDLAPEGFYADALAVFARKRDIGVVFGKIEPFGSADISAERDYFDRAHRRAGRCGRLGPKLGFGAAMFFLDSLLVCSAAMIRKRCVVEIGGFCTDMALAEDVDLYARAIRKFGAVHLDRTSLHYRYGPSLSNRANIKPLLEESYRAIQTRCRRENGAVDFYAMKILAKILGRFDERN